MSGASLHPGRRFTVLDDVPSTWRKSDTLGHEKTRPSPPPKYVYVPVNLMCEVLVLININKKQLLIIETISLYVSQVLLIGACPLYGGLFRGPILGDFFVTYLEDIDYTLHCRHEHAVIVLVRIGNAVVPHQGVVGPVAPVSHHPPLLTLTLLKNHFQRFHRLQSKCSKSYMYVIAVLSVTAAYIKLSKLALDSVFDWDCPYSRHQTCTVLLMSWYISRSLSFRLRSLREKQTSPVAREGSPEPEDTHGTNLYT